jgi:carboxyl-terminal processing protease
MNRWSKSIRLGILMGLVALIVYLAFQPAFRPLFTLEYWQAIHRYAVVLRIMKAEQVDADKWSVKEVSQQGIQAMLQSVDPYAEWISGDSFHDFVDFRDQRYVGIGVEVGYNQDRLVVLSPFEGGAAQEAGIFPGDQIVKVNGESVIGRDFQDVVARLRGEDGSVVDVGIYRPSSDEEISFVLKRREIAVATLASREWLRPQIGYLRISRFGNKTADEVIKALHEMESEGMRGLVLDLRNNPGGILISCLELLGYFYPRDTVLLRMVSPAKGLEVVELNQEDGKTPDYPIAVLIDKGSASAAEIMAAVLQESGLARVFGEPSYGKATVQSVLQIGYDEALRLTTARYRTPGGSDISGEGVIPDVHTGMAAEDTARVFLQKRMESHLGRELFLERFGGEWVQDVTLERALQWVERAVQK